MSDATSSQQQQQQLPQPRRIAPIGGDALPVTDASLQALQDDLADLSVEQRLALDAEDLELQLAENASDTGDGFDHMEEQKGLDENEEEDEEEAAHNSGRKKKRHEDEVRINRYNEIDSLAGYLFSSGGQGMHEYTVKGDDDEEKRAQGQTIKVELKSAGQGVTDGDEEVDDDSDNEEDFMGKSVYVEQIRARVNTQADVIKAAAPLSSHFEHIVENRENRDILDLVSKERYNTLREKYRQWDYFFTRNYHSGLRLSTVEQKSKHSDALHVYSVLSKLHTLLMNVEHAGMAAPVERGRRISVPFWCRSVMPAGGASSEQEMQPSHWSTNDALLWKRISSMVSMTYEYQDMVRPEHNDGDDIDDSDEEEEEDETLDPDYVSPVQWPMKVAVPGLLFQHMPLEMLPPDMHWSNLLELSASQIIQCVVAIYQNISCLHQCKALDDDPIVDRTINMSNGDDDDEEPGGSGGLGRFSQDETDRRLHQQRMQQRAQHSSPIIMEFEYYVELLKYRMGVISAGLWTDAVMDVAFYRELGMPDTKSSTILYRTSKAWLMFCANFSFMLNVLVNLNYYVMGANAMTLNVHRDGGKVDIDMMLQVNEEIMADEELMQLFDDDTNDECPLHVRDYVSGGHMEEGLQAILIRYLFENIGEDVNTMEGFSTEVNVIVEKCVLIPGLRPWYEYGRVKTLKSYWHERANGSQATMRLVDTYMSGAYEMLEAYMLQFQRYVDNGKPAQLFELFINRFMLTDFLKKENFEMCFLNAQNRTFLQRSLVDSLLSDGTKNSWNAYMFVCSVTHRAIMIRTLSKILTAKAHLKEGIDPWIIYLSESLIINKNLICRLRLSATPLIVQIDPLKFNVYCRGIVYDCGYDIRRTLLTWLLLIKQSIGGVLKLGNRIHNLNAFLDQVLGLRFQTKPDAGTMLLFRVGSTHQLVQERKKQREAFEKSAQGTTKVLGNQGLSGLQLDLYGTKKRRLEAQAANKMRAGDLMTEGEQKDDDDGDQQDKARTRIGDIEKSDNPAAGGDEDEEMVDADAYGDDRYTINVEKLMDSGYFNGSMAKRLQSVFGEMHPALVYSGDFEEGTGGAAAGAFNSSNAAGTRPQQQQGSSAAKDRLNKLAETYASRDHYYEGGQGARTWNPHLQQQKIRTAVSESEEASDSSAAAAPSPMQQSSSEDFLYENRDEDDEARSQAAAATSSSQGLMEEAMLPPRPTRPAPPIPSSASSRKRTATGERVPSTKELQRRVNMVDVDAYGSEWQHGEAAESRERERGNERSSARVAEVYFDPQRDAPDDVINILNRFKQKN